jgi:hypothetical protein
MMVGIISKREFRKALLHLGFVEDQGTKHILFDFYYQGRVVVQTAMSRGGGKDVSKSLLAHILRYELFLTRDEFVQALRGELDERGYIAILAKKCIIEVEC